MMILILFWASLLSAKEYDAPTTHVLSYSSQFDTDSYVRFVKKTYETCQDYSCQIQMEYLKARMLLKSEKDLSCELYSKHSTDVDFSFSAVSLLRYLQSCKEKITNPAAYLKEVENRSKQINRRWLKAELWLATANLFEPQLTLFREGHSANPPKAQLELFVETSLRALDFVTQKAKKVELLQKAIASALLYDENKALELQKLLYKTSPKLQPIPEDWFAVGVEAKSDFDFVLATTAFQKIVESASSTIAQRRSALENLKVTYKALQRRGEAEFASERLRTIDENQFQKNPKNSKVIRNLLNSSLSLSRAYWTAHKNKEALMILDSTEKLLKKKVSLSEIYYLRSRILFESRKTKQSNYWLKRAIKASEDTLKTSYLWMQAWIDYKNRDYLESSKALEELREIETDTFRKAQQTFWLAKSYQALNRTDEAKPIFENLIKEDPLGYYSLLSYRELKWNIPKPEEITSTDFTRVPRKTEVEKSKFDENLFGWLLATEEKQLARHMLNEELPVPDITSEDWHEVFLHYAKANYFNPIFTRLARLNNSEKESLMALKANLLFPQPFEGTVIEASQNSGLWPEFIWAIMRQESSFDPTSISPANAYGAMQILPQIARHIASDEIKTPEDLLDPQINIQIGAKHLRDYWDVFNGQFILAAAAYNASPETVTNWMKTRFRGDMVEFIEDIPYEETRTYVKLVLRNFINYMRLNSREAFVVFPDWCLEKS